MKVPLAVSYSSKLCRRMNCTAEVHEWSVGGCVLVTLYFWTVRAGMLSPVCPYAQSLPQEWRNMTHPHMTLTTGCAYMGSHVSLTVQWRCWGTFRFFFFDVTNLPCNEGALHDYNLKAKPNYFCVPTTCVMK